MNEQDITTGQGFEERDYGQEVISVIKFPLGQDWIAVGKALNYLLTEGWRFRQLNKDSIEIERSWYA